MVHRLSHLEEFDWIFWPFHYHLAATNVFVQLCHDVSTVFVNVCLQKLQKTVDLNTFPLWPVVASEQKGHTPTTKGRFVRG